MHKRIGLIGGTTPESTVGYYQYLTGKYFEKHGNHSFPEILIFSVSFQELVDWGTNGQWHKVEEKLVSAALTLEKGGAEIICLTANTLHKFFHQIKNRLTTPMISIIDTLIEAVKVKGLSKVALLGTKPTMEEKFYIEALAAAGIEAIVPDSLSREFIHRNIYDDLSRGIVTAEAKGKYLEIADTLAADGAEGIILGCTEIPMILTSSDTDLPLFDTLEIHAEKILEWATSKV